jgi:hypothetical protein
MSENAGERNLSFQAEILLKVALNTINPTLTHFKLR